MKDTRYIIKMAQDAKEASRQIANLSTSRKNKTLLAMANSLKSSKRSIILANKKDLRLAKRKGLSQAMVDRLTLTESRINSMVNSLRRVARLKDPIGEIIQRRRRPNGLKIKKIRTSIGVIGIIYESRPNVTCDCVALCLKTGNSVILKGGKEAINSNIAIFKALEKAVARNSLPKASINLITTTDRRAVSVLLGLSELVNLIIPRGGEGLIRQVARLSKIPVVKHYKGVCHTYVDEAADLNVAQKICYNAKVQRPGVCNAMETLLVHEDVAVRFLPGMIKEFKKAGVKVKGCAITRKIVKSVKPVSLKDWSEEYLDLILSVKVVSNLNEAIEHINRFGSMHSDAIITDDKKSAEKFLKEIDSACVYVNASTRFTDGGEFGLGAEIGISTDKIHARGPMALEELTTYKYIIVGSGQIRS